MVGFSCLAKPLQSLDLPLFGTPSLLYVHAKITQHLFRALPCSHCAQCFVLLPELQVFVCTINASSGSSPCSGVSVCRCFPWLFLGGPARKLIANATRNIQTGGLLKGPSEERRTQWFMVPSLGNVDASWCYVDNNNSRTNWLSVTMSLTLTLTDDQQGMA